MKRLVLAIVAIAALSACVSVRARETHRAPTGEIVRTYASPTAAFAASIVIPPGYETIRLPGMIADPLNPGSAAAARFGDTQSQTASVLHKIAAALAELGASEGDVAAMTVYLVAPDGTSMMDFEGMMRAYSRHYGSETQPNRPVRSTVQVAGLARPGLLVEIEVTAARRAK